MAIETEAYEAMEAFESESESESAEAAPFRRPSSRSSYVPRSFGPTPPVSQPQLQAALSRVDSKIKTVSDVEANINSRVNTLAGATKKEVADRKKSIDSQVKDLNQKVQLLTLLPLLLQPPTATVTTPTGTATALVQDTNKLNAILPLLLVGGLGGSGGLSSGGDGGSSAGGSDSSFLILALALAFSRP